MSQQITIDIIRTVKKAHENIMVSIGVFIGILLIVYFFDRGYMAVVYFQALTSIALVVALFFLKRIAFVVVRSIYGRRAAYQTFLSAIVASDLDKDEKALEEEFGSSGMHA